MAKKYYHISDEEGNKFDVEEVSAREMDTDEEEFSEEEFHDGEDTLTPDEISALKSLAAAAPQLLGLLQTHDSDEDEDDETHDEDEEESDITDEDEDEDERVVDTDEDEDDKKGVKDSFGSVRKKSKTKDSSKEAREQAVADSWARKYSEVK